MIRCEMAIAVASSDGDRGTWSTDYVEIPEQDEKDIEARAIKALLAQPEYAITQMPFEISHIWLYHWEYIGEDENG